RAKDFFAVNAHVGTRMVEQRWPDKKSCFVPRYAGFPAIDDEYRALGDTAIDESDDAIARRARDDRPHVGFGAIARSYPDTTRALCELHAQWVTRTGHRSHPRIAHAALAR